MDKKFNFFLIILISIVLLMSIGYSALNKSLSISGNLTYRPQKDVRITNFTTSNKPSNMTINYSDFSKTEVKLGYTTTGSANITYNIEVTNFSSTAMGILKIDGLNDNILVQKDIVGSKLVGPAEINTFTITFNSPKEEIKTYLLTFEFAPVYKITYNGFSNIENYKKEILETENLNQKLAKDSQLCSVTMNGSLVKNYTFSNDLLNIPNVTGDIVITGGDAIEETALTTPNKPELNGDMIPVYYKQETTTTGNWVKADVTNKDNNWYDYEHQKWANAVTVKEEKRQELLDAPVGTVVETDMNTMWVWIPRYSYTIKKEACSSDYYGKGSYGNTTPTKSLPGEIDVKFIPVTENDTGTGQYTNATNNNVWITNDAFNFPETDESGKNTSTPRAGIWVSKTEVGGRLSKDFQACTDDNCDVSKIQIKPGQNAIIHQSISSFFFASRSMQNDTKTFGFDNTTGDLHVIKNDEWGAVAYLSQSKYGKYGNNDYEGKNKMIYVNPDETLKTGRSNGSPIRTQTQENYLNKDMTDLGLDEDGNKRGKAGPGASTTGTIYGLFDMSGGAYDMVMGVLEYDAQKDNTHLGLLETKNSGFKGLDSEGLSVGNYDLPNEKYYNVYKLIDPTIDSYENDITACNGKICYGHALSETREWNDTVANNLKRDNPWFRRGGVGVGTNSIGLLSRQRATGGNTINDSTRFVLTP